MDTHDVPPTNDDLAGIDPVVTPETMDDEPGTALDESLTDEIAALIDDGKTYAEAEIAFQKTRASFVADRGKSAALYGLFALGFVHLALIALVVGAVISLMPLLGPVGATLLVTIVLLGIAILLVFGVRSKAREIADAFKDGER